MIEREALRHSGVSRNMTAFWIFRKFVLHKEISLQALRGNRVREGYIFVNIMTGKKIVIHEKKVAQNMFKSKVSSLCNQDTENLQKNFYCVESLMNLMDVL